MTEPAKTVMALRIGIVGEDVALALYDNEACRIVGGIRLSPEQAYQVAQTITLSGIKAEERKKNRS